MDGTVSLRAYNATVLQQLRPGDRIEFPRASYSHWGIYLGNEEVIHVAGDDNDGLNGALPPGSMFSCSGVRTSKAKVTIDNFWTVVGQSKARKNNNRDRTTSPLSPRDIVRRAKEKLYETGYNIFKWNCEHFVNWCRYGEATSDQVNAVMTGAAVVGLGVLGAVAAFGLYKLVGGNKEEDEREKK